MKKLLNTLMAAAAAMALAQGAAAAADAQALINSKGCAGCHGADGNSAAPTFPKLAGQGAKYIAKQLVDIRDGNRPVAMMMGAVNGLTDADAQAIGEYYAANTTQLSGAKEGKVTLNNGATVDSLKLGAKVYRAGNKETGVPACTGCHSPTGQGNAPAGFPKLGGQHAAYIATQLKAFRSGARANDGEAMTMRMVAEQMSDAEIEAVSNFISGLH